MAPDPTLFERYAERARAENARDKAAEVGRALSPVERDALAQLPVREGSQGVFRVLSLDGGGIRGLAAVRVLEEIERQTGKPIGESFDLITGTSAGGIIALGLTRPDPANPGKPLYRAADLARMFQEFGDDVFQKKWYTPIVSLFQPRYREDQLARKLGEYFGDAEVAQATTDVLVHSYDVISQQPVQIRTRRHGHDPAQAAQQWNYRMADAAMGTSAAPTYFRPHGVTPLNGPTPMPQLLVDGGIYANNPAVFGLKEAQKIMPPDKEVVVVSIGTGTTRQPYRPERVRNWGALAWGNPFNGLPVLDMVLNAQARGADQVMKTALGDRYIRINIDTRDPRLGDDAPNPAFDDATPDNLRRLERMAQLMVRDHAQEIARASQIVATGSYVSRDGFREAFLARNAHGPRGPAVGPAPGAAPAPQPPQGPRPTRDAVAPRLVA